MRRECEPYSPVMRELQHLLDDFMTANPDMPGVVMHVEAPRLNIRWTGSAGVVERGGAALQPDACFRIASVTKTFVAAAIMRLSERAQLSVDDRVVQHLPDAPATLLAEAVPEAGRITIRQLLQHTSGLYDFGRDDTYRATIAREPHKVWSAIDLLSLAFDHGTSYGPPGHGFQYSDTGYVLLALVLEQHSGLPFAAALRSILDLDGRGLASTWLEGKEPAPASAPVRAHQYMGQVDTFGFDPSFDGYGGGGLVSTSRDLAAFVRSLVADDLLSLNSRAEMLRANIATDLGDLGQQCGLGIFESTFDGVTQLGHEGFWGVWMYHVPLLRSRLMRRVPCRRRR